MWKPLDLCLPRKTLIKKQYHSPGGITDISTVIKDLKSTELVFPITFPIILLICPVQRTQGSWRTTGGYCEVNYVVTPVAAAVAHVAPLFEPWAHPLVPAVQWLTYLFLHSRHEVHELVLHDAHTPPRKHSCITLLPLRDTSERSGDGKFSRWVELWEVNLPVLFASMKKMARYMMIHRVRNCSQWFDWMVMNLKGRCLENWWQ